MRLNNFWNSLLTIAIVAIIGVILWLGITQYLEPTKVINSPNACPQDAKLCPNGSYVGRVGPNCEFADCATASVPDAWKIFGNNQKAVTFKYPPDFSTKYISIVDWPPAVQILNQAFSCTEGGSEIERAGKTEKKTINGHNYCVTMESEGAAGSIYTNYAYAFAAGQRTIIFTFSLRFSQCANYDDPKKTECEAERSVFTPDAVLDKMAQSVTLNQ